MKRLLIIILALATMQLRAQNHHSDALDDVLQHAPMASVFVLKACGVSNETSWQQLALTGAASYVLSAATTYSLKQVVQERRPDKSDRRSFPSGHATFAFAGATMLAHEYGHSEPWVAIGGYTLASLVAVDRLVRDRHYLHDVCAGAVIGVAGTELSYYLQRQLLPKLFKNDHASFAVTSNGVYFAYNW